MRVFIGRAIQDWFDGFTRLNRFLSKLDLDSEPVVCSQNDGSANQAINRETMQPGKTSVIQLFSAPVQYVVPVFQRGYVWTLEKQVIPLWADLETRAAKLIERDEMAQQVGAQSLKALQKHFLGSIVLTPVHSTFGRVTAYEVIDGQQRTTTLHLLLLAFRHAAQLMQESPISQMLDGLVRNPGPYAQTDDHHKVWPTQAGRVEMAFLDKAADCIAVCEKYPVKAGKQKAVRPLMVQAYLYLHLACMAFIRGVSLEDPVESGADQSWSDALVHSVRNDNLAGIIDSGIHPQPARAEKLFMALQELVQIMTLTLEAEDDPQVIFETLNARGEPLLASDLVRNFVFLDAARRNLSVDDLYNAHWKGFDEQSDLNNVVTANRYWRERERQGRITHPRIDLFFFHYTVLKMRQETLVSHVFQSFKDWWQSETRDISLELQRIVRTSEFFKQLITPVGDGFIAEFGRLIKALDVSTLTPVYLALRERLDDDDPRLKQALSDLASFVTRRSICGLTTKSYNKIFMKLLVDVSDCEEPSAALRSSLLKLGGHSQVWPTDADVRDAWLDRPVYKEMRPMKVGAVLRGIELAIRTPKQESSWSPVPELLSVEHVLPQSWEGTGNYPLEDESDDLRLRRNRLVQTFGNLTLLTQPMNSSVSNGPFQDVERNGELVEGKRSAFRGSLLLLNSYFSSLGLTAWRDAQIKQRGEVLLSVALKNWPYPNQSH